MARHRPRLSRSWKEFLESRTALVDKALAGRLRDFLKDWRLAPPKLCLKWAAEFSERLLYGNVELPEHVPAAEINRQTKIIKLLSEAAESLSLRSESSLLVPVDVKRMDDLWLGLMDWAPEVCLDLVSLELPKRFRSLTEHQRRKIRGYFQEMFVRYRKGRAPGQHAPHAPRSEETPLWIQQKVQAAYLKYVRKKSWRAAANKLRIADDRQLRRDVKKLGRLVHDELTQKYWVDPDGENLDSLLSQEVPRTYL